MPDIKWVAWHKVKKCFRIETQSGNRYLMLPDGKNYGKAKQL